MEDKKVLNGVNDADYEIAYKLVEEFLDIIKFEKRFFIPKKFLEIFDDIFEEYKFDVDIGQKLYRCRVHEIEHRKSLGIPEVFKDEEIGIPPNSKVQGRINPKGIRYLYLADNEEVAISEVNPIINDYVTIGEFKTKKCLKVIRLPKNFVIIDSNRPKNKYGPSVLLHFITYFTKEFYKSVKETEKDMEYLATQIFSEYCKESCYDGIMYPSSKSNKDEFEAKSDYNLVLFDSKNASWIKSKLVKIKRIEYSYETI